MDDKLLNEIKFLIKQSKLYYNGKSPEISDIEFDKREEDVYKKLNKDEINKLWKKLHFPKSVTKFETKNHKIPMRSLNKISPNSNHSIESYLSNIPNIDIVVQEKLDGISLSLNYEKGKLVSALLRNNGIKGDDIISNAKFFKGIPLKLDKEIDVSIRGEVIIKKDDFKKLNKKSNNKYKSLRNSVSGISRNYNGNYVKYLSFISYDIKTNDLEFNYESEKYVYLKELGFEVVKTYHKVTRKEKLNDIIDDYINNKRQKLDYLIDGLVFKYTQCEKNINYEKNSDLQIAYKFPEETGISNVIGVDFQYGINRITPVLKIEPIELNGVTISKATLHNISKFNKYQLHIGDSVEIKRSGDVIPYFNKIVESNGGELIKRVHNCKYCGKELYEDETYLYCNNPKCDMKKIGDIKNYITKLDYKGIANSTIKQLFENELVYNIVDLYRLDKDDLIIEGEFGETQSENIIKILDSKNNIPFYKILGSLNISHLSIKRAEVLINELKIDSIEKLRKITTNDIQSIDGFDTISDSLKNDILNKIEIIEELMIEKPDLIDFTLTQNENAKFFGITFCFTGNGDLPRKKLQEIVKLNGGKVRSSVSKKLNYLVSCDNNISGKNKKAEEYGVKIISEDELLEMME